MTNLWTERAAVVVPAAKKDDANLMAKVLGNGTDEELKTFGRMKLSPSGNLPATHYGVNTALYLSKKQLLIDLFESEEYAGAGLRFEEAEDSPGEVLTKLLLYMGLVQIEDDNVQ